MRRLCADQRLDLALFRIHTRDEIVVAASSGGNLLHLRLGWTQRLGAWQLRQTLRIDNLSDRRYVGSVIVNDSNRRFFEPGPGRQWSLGLSAGHTF